MSADSRISSKSCGYVLLVLAAFLPLLRDSLTRHDPGGFVLDTAVPPSDGPSAAPLYRTDSVQTCGPDRRVHCATITEIAGGRLLAVWFEGSQECEPDVALFGSTWDPKSKRWSPARLITDAGRTQSDLGRLIRTTGSPALLRHPDGTVYLFYVTTSIGGWAVSAINVKTSTDDGETWTPARRLVLSPFFNFSTQVKCTPLLYADGSMGLPVHHEGLARFAEYVFLSRSGEVLDIARMSHGRESREPSVVVLDHERAIGLLRFFRGDGGPGRILVTRTQDEGRHWTRPKPNDLPNPDSAVMALRMPDASLLLVFNNTGMKRYLLSLARSTDEGNTWSVIHDFERENPARIVWASEFSYPFIIRTRDGLLHLVYTWHRLRIKHIIFNEAWVKGLKGGEAP